MSAFLPPEDLVSWGWRVPFLASALLIGIGLYIRLNIHETPVFTKPKCRNPQ
jgi:MFS family permease